MADGRGTDEWAAEEAVVLGWLERIFVAPRGGARPVAVEEALAVADRGLAGDRYGERRGSGSGWDECQVTLIRHEHVLSMARDFGVKVLDGEHRRNLVVRGFDPATLTGGRFRIGEAVFAYDRPRPPCKYIGTITEPTMPKALGKNAGICARVLVGGRLRVGDAVVRLEGGAVDDEEDAPPFAPI